MDAQEAPTARLTEYGIPIRNVWHMLLYAWNELPHSRYWQRVDAEAAPSLDALLASVLVDSMQQRLRIGLGSSYVPEQRLLRGVRGRVHFTKSLKQRAFQRGQAFCEFEHYSINAPKNQIIRSTLYQLAQTGDFGPDRQAGEALRHRIRLLVRLLDAVDLVELTPDFIHRQQVERHDRDYRIMLAICAFILQKRMPTEYDGAVVTTKLERDHLLLYRVFERFVANFYRYHLPHWEVRAQRTLTWHEQEPNPYLPTMRPDLELQDRRRGRVIILDTKFTAGSLTKHWGKATFASSHLYQMYTYLRTQEHLSPAHAAAEGILLYPAANHTLAETIALAHHCIHINAVDLAAPWQHIEHALLNLIPDQTPPT